MFSAIPENCRAKIAPSVAVATESITETGMVQLSYCATRNRYATRREIISRLTIFPSFRLS